MTPKTRTLAHGAKLAGISGVGRWWKPDAVAVHHVFELDVLSSDDSEVDVKTLK